MQDITEFLEERKRSCEERAERTNEQIDMFKRWYTDNENAHVNIVGYPNAKVVDEHGREQYNQAIKKQNELYAISDFIIELQERYFN